MAKEDVEKRSEILFEKLVPSSGPAETREGEMLRAINKIVYRYYNDGDHFDKGYGCETTGPAHAFLVSIDTPIRTKLKEIFARAENTNDDNYEAITDEALEVVVSYIEECNEYTPNSVDMYEYDALFEDEEDEDEEYEDEEDN